MDRAKLLTFSTKPWHQNGGLTEKKRRFHWRSMALRSGRSRVGKAAVTFCAFARRYWVLNFWVPVNVFNSHLNTIIHSKTALSWPHILRLWEVFTFCGAFSLPRWLQFASSCSDPTCESSCWTAVSPLGYPLATTERLIFASEEIDPHLSPRPLWLLCHTGRGDENSVWPSPSPLRSPASSIAVANNSEFHNSSRKGTIREKSFLFDNLIVQTNHLVDTGHSSPHKQTKTRPFP